MRIKKQLCALRIAALQAAFEPSQKFLVSLPPLDPRSQDAVVLERLPDLIGECAVNASLAVERRRVAAGAVFDQIRHDVEVAAQARVVTVTSIALD